MIRCLINPPVMVQREGKPSYASFSKLQYWAYPELCKAQAEEALSYCDLENQIRQRAILACYFGESSQQKSGR